MIKDIDGASKTKARDQYKHKIKDRECGIINMDLSTGSGSHYVCFFNSPQHDHVYYYDSYGVIPPTEIVQFLQQGGKGICYNSTQHQPIKSVLCGWYCIKVLRELDKGRKFSDILLDFEFDPDKNEKMIIKEFRL